jgi:hypothetical protein
MEHQHMSALDASQDREGHEIDSGGRSESDDEFDQDSVAIGILAAAARAKLADQLLASGRTDAAVEAAFRRVPRHTFLPEMDPVEAYQDRAVVIKSDSEGLPVSASTQPTMIAVMLSQLGLAARHRVLEIGTGTGYNAALIAHLVGDQESVVTIDVVPDLIGQARVNLAAAGTDGQTRSLCQSHPTANCEPDAARRPSPGRQHGGTWRRSIHPRRPASAVRHHCPRLRS